jgi:heat shock protein HslJ
MAAVYLSSAMLSVASAQIRATDPLPSWNDGPARQAIVSFVERATTEGSADFVPPAERIATFDNDGTLWCEQPAYFQGLFAFDRIKALAPQHPEWKHKEPFKSVLAGDKQGLAAAGKQGLLEVLAATHAGMTVDDFHTLVRDWMRTARHPRFNRPYNKCIYQPMVEVLRYLRANGFKTFIVSGGGVEFMRPWVEEAYGIPPEQVVGSSGVVKFEMRGDEALLMKEPKVEFIDDGPGKPVGINRFIGRRPIMAFGNSDGDLQMLQYTTAKEPSEGGRQRPRFALIVHHTDADREYAYDRDSHVGRLDKALDEAKQRGWTVVSMKDDWKTIFPKIDDGGNAMLDGSWVLASLNGKPIAGDEISLEFDSAAGRASGSTGVNRWSGGFKFDGQSIKFGPLVTTRRAGPPEAMQLEREFTQALDSAAEITGDAERLVLSTGDEQELVFKRRQP